MACVCGDAVIELVVGRMREEDLTAGHVIIGGGWLSVTCASFILTLWLAHVFRERIAQLRHEILVLSSVKVTVIVRLCNSSWPRSRLAKESRKRTSRASQTDALCFRKGDVHGHSVTSAMLLLTACTVRSMVLC